MNELVKPVNSWNIRRIVIAVLLGTMTATYLRAFDFWPLGVADGLRALLDLAGPLILLAVVLTLLVWLASAFMALYRQKFQRAVGNFIAILSVPACSAILLATSISDPWVWYVVLNKSRFETAAANSPSMASPKFVVLEERDISTGIAGVTENHFVALIYSESDPDELASSIPGLRHIYGNFYRRDKFM
ncbi:hypothetical protein NFO65_20190 [Neorhizobium galegae]|uniref:hypothetical protein n=1 Tax=Neorhizobium galegae TaxID=399 RepID=UPI002100B8C7|nr:hypothetical protein [Neorhizobium galegae]MCQ1573050.1 hypothetical protein [Neorhizobium galegae]